MQVYKFLPLLKQLNPWTYTQTYTPTVVQGGRGGGLLQPLPWVSAELQ